MFDIKLVVFRIAHIEITPLVHSVCVLDIDEPNEYFNLYNSQETIINQLHFHLAASCQNRILKTKSVDIFSPG